MSDIQKELEEIFCLAEEEDEFLDAISRLSALESKEAWHIPLLVEAMRTDEYDVISAAVDALCDFVREPSMKWHAPLQGELRQFFSGEFLPYSLFVQLSELFVLLGEEQKSLLPDILALTTRQKCPRLQPLFTQDSVLRPLLIDSFESCFLRASSSGQNMLLSALMRLDTPEPQAIKQLIRLLRLPLEDDVMRSVVEFVGRLEENGGLAGEWIVERLLDPSIEDSESLRAVCVRALGQLKWEHSTSLDCVLQVMDDELAQVDKEELECSIVLFECIRTLGALGGERAIEKLCELLQQRIAFLEVVRVCTMLGDQAQQAVPLLLAFLQEDGGAEALSGEEYAYSALSYQREECLGALGHLRGPAEDVLPVLREYIAFGSEEEQQSACDALYFYSQDEGSLDFVPLLFDMSRSDSGESMRLASWSLAAIIYAHKERFLQTYLTDFFRIVERISEDIDKTYMPFANLVLAFGCLGVAAHRSLPLVLDLRTFDGGEYHHEGDKVRGNVAWVLGRCVPPPSTKEAPKPHLFENEAEPLSTEDALVLLWEMTDDESDFVKMEAVTALIRLEQVHQIDIDVLLETIASQVLHFQGMYRRNSEQLAMIAAEEMTMLSAALAQKIEGFRHAHQPLTQTSLTMQQYADMQKHSRQILGVWKEFLDEMPLHNPKLHRSCAEAYEALLLLDEFLQQEQEKELKADLEESLFF